MKLGCLHLSTCRGCPLGTLDDKQQKIVKKQKFLDSLEQTLPTVMIRETKYDFVFPAFDHYRTRCDFIYSDGKLGWIDKNRKFLPIDECPLHVPELKFLADKITKLSWPVQRGSMRLRVSPSGTFGLWLDLANLDIKELLSEAKILNELFESNIVVEMGQKGKRVVRSGDGFKLSDPTPYPWFKSEIVGTTVELSSLISSFTQTSPELNLKMIQILKSILGAKTYSEIVEFGCGVGNFTLFLSGYANAVKVIENDQRNLIPLKHNIETFALNGKITIFESVRSFFNGTAAIKQDSLYFVNPSRSGVGALFDQPIPAQNIVYVSCHLESFLTDVVKLNAQGFRLQQATLFDQFPHSEHFEIISLLSI